MKKHFEIDDVVCFRYKKTETLYKVKILKKFQGHDYLIKILESDLHKFAGTEKRIDFDSEYNKKEIEFISVESDKEHFEEVLAKYEAAKYFNCCLEAVNTKDEAWFNESFAQYALWKTKIKEVGSEHEELN